MSEQAGDARERETLDSAPDTTGDNQAATTASSAGAAGDGEDSSLDGPERYAGDPVGDDTDSAAIDAYTAALEADVPEQVG
jgi:hypothetical protein